jgi:hypothetical protein
LRQFRYEEAVGDERLFQAALSSSNSKPALQKRAFAGGFNADQKVGATFAKDGS